MQDVFEKYNWPNKTVSTHGCVRHTAGHMRVRTEPGPALAGRWHRAAGPAGILQLYCRLPPHLPGAISPARPLLLRATAPVMGRLLRHCQHRPWCAGRDGAGGPPERPPQWERTPGCGDGAVRCRASPGTPIGSPVLPPCPQGSSRPRCAAGACLHLLRRAAQLRRDPAAVDGVCQQR